MAKSKKPVVPFQEVLAQLLDNQRPFPPYHLHRFSDLAGNDLAQFKAAWPKVGAKRRLSLMEDLEELAENDTLVSFDEIAKFALKDSDARVRAVALRSLWECEDRKLIPIFLEMLQKDADEVVRATAAAALGAFVYQGELEELPEEILRKIEEALLAVQQGKDVDLVRRRALEALGYSSRAEVPTLLQQALASQDKEWVASALFAIGRSADNRWEQSVLRYLNAPEIEVQLEAVRAAGQLELEAAREGLLSKLPAEAETDEDVLFAAVWSLSQIGGEDVRPALEKMLEETEDEDEAELIETALDNLAFTEDVSGYGLFDFGGGGKEENTRIIDLSNLGDEDDDDDEPGDNGRKVSRN